MESEEIPFNFKHTRLERIPLSKIRENAEALRKVVDKEDPRYVTSLDSVRKRGVMNPILVREIKDPSTGELLYGLIDGLHRFNWSMDAGYTDIPANIGSLAEADLLEAQIMANVHKIETKPMQYTRALIAVLASNPVLSMTELAARISMGEEWLRDRLGLINLKAEIQPLVESGELKLMHAYSLSKLPEDKQVELLQSALSKPFLEFGQQAKQALSEVNKAKREGRKAETNVFRPTPRLQRLALITDESDNATLRPDQSAVIAQAGANGCENTAAAGIAYALRWVLHLDPVSIAQDKAKWESDKAAAEAESARKKEARDAAKQAAAAAVASNV